MFKRQKHEFEVEVAAKICKTPSIYIAPYVANQAEVQCEIQPQITLVDFICHFGNELLLISLWVTIWFAEADRWINKELDKLPKSPPVSIVVVFATFQM